MKSKSIVIINGPNLNMQGRRQTDVYGTETFDDLLHRLNTDWLDVDFVLFQSNHEGELVDLIQQQTIGCQGLIINPGAYTHTSVAVADAVATCGVPVIEVHISNLAKREVFRHKSLVAHYCIGSIIGLGMSGYELAARHLIMIDGL
jgi:3-dehydroquinate dehydratase II